MDIESDDSERWEDFFGSSTNLAPSLIALYDTLTESLETSFGSSSSVTTIKSQSSETVRVSNDDGSISEEDLDKSTKSVDSNSLSSSSSSNSTTTTTTTARTATEQFTRERETPSSGRHRSNIRILSPNVQRLLSHSNSSIEATTSSTPPGNTTNSHQRTTKKTLNGNNSIVGGKHQVKLSNIPLSKGTCKLTQSGGNDLVQTFDSSSEYLDNPGVESMHRTKNKTFLSSVDNDKTPTNNESFVFAECQATIKTTKQLSVATATAPQSSVDMEKQQQKNSLRQNCNDFATETIDDPKNIAEAYNYRVASSTAEMLLSLNKTVEKQTDIIRTRSHLESNDIDLIETINKSPPPSMAAAAAAVQLFRSSSSASASTTISSPMLTYARAKMLAVAAKANTLGSIPQVKLPTAKQLEDLEEASKMSAESLDRLTDIKSRFSPKESRKMSCLMLPDIAKLKHRPLSSSSICSTSSSSSSGSDHLNSQRLTATAYLASVESLADQSENELMDPHSTMTVFERSCMEIVDSERSYVVDLGQVIRGYLHDWKERACLRYDELSILFSNIEEIYEFNSALLKQLINSGMDPVKIAKCFIDMKERFDVYTTYCTSYPEAISLLTSLLQATHTNALLTSTQKMLQHTLPLGSYLLKPVQRILKYHLLLDNLRKYCDIKEVFQAHEIMRQVARNIDQVKRKLEQQSRVKELSGILDGWLGPELTVLGELRQEGLVMEHNKPRMIFLFATMLIITKPKEDNRLQFKSYIHQNNLMLSEHLPGEPTSFYVIPYDDPRNQIKLTTKNRDQKRLWAQHIKGVILEKFDNIPNRAKELVYKLGDEEDRTPDKNTWKWSLHSTSTPVYLERRNQYRRSEMRNRSKVKRKTVTNSTSFEGFSGVGSKVALVNGHKSLVRNRSMDDNMIPALQNPQESPSLSTKDEKHSNNSKQSAKCCCSKVPDCNCIIRSDHMRRCDGGGGGGAMLTKSTKERSKSVPRISVPSVDDIDDSDDLKGALDSRKSKSHKSVEIKMYNTKTIPKRIVSLKKSRTTKKETSKFYMDLSEFDEPMAVLKITESTENLIDGEEISPESSAAAAAAAAGKEDENSIEKKKKKKTGDDGDDDDLVDIDEKESKLIPLLSPAEKIKHDAQIILDLLKDSKEFERLYKKPQKKKSLDNGSASVTSPEPSDSAQSPSDIPPRPPSTSPPPLDVEVSAAGVAVESEPIYESLLRNVHVPYKFSPILNRSKSQQYYKSRDKKKTNACCNRPESDYVTLVYSASGNLQKIGNDFVAARSPLQGNSQFRSSDSKINYDSITSNANHRTSSASVSSAFCRDSQSTVIHFNGGVSNVLSSSSSSQRSSNNVMIATSAVEQPIYSRPIPKNLMKRLLSTNSSSSTSSSSSSSSSAKTSAENVSSSESSLLPRVRKSVDNISLGFGRSNKPPERRVSDVSEMCRQSIIHRQGSEAVGERMAHLDYADPKTLFAASMCDSLASLNLQRDSAFSLTSSSDSVCDSKQSGDNRELTADGSFQYEDNVEACLESDFRDSAVYSDNDNVDKRHETTVNSCDDGDFGYVKRAPPTPPARNKKYHPQIPPKPASVKSPTKAMTATMTTETIVCPPHMSSVASRSWVLQQIENFNK